MSNQPRTLPHTFKLDPLRLHFAKSPTPTAAVNLIDLEPGAFLDTEEEMNVCLAVIWMMSVRFDQLGEKERPGTREEVRRWILKNRSEPIAKIAGKIEPPFAAWSIDQIQRDVGAIMEEMLLKTLPPQDLTKDAGKAAVAKK